MKNPQLSNFKPLFKLVKSLTMSERIYFKKHTSVSIPNVEGKLLELSKILGGMNVSEQHNLSLHLKKWPGKAQAIFQ